MKILFQYILLFFIFTACLSETQGQAIKVNYNRLYKSQVNQEAFEVGEIKFHGNTFFDEELLINVLNSKKTSRSIPYGVFEFTYSKAKNNILVPAFVKRNLEKNLAAISENELIRFAE